LADGTVFHGKSIGKKGSAFGEVCFNTGTTGYQEIFTDPSYFGQLMVATNAHIGNYGTMAEEVESNSVKIAGLICKNFASITSLTFNDDHFDGFTYSEPAGHLLPEELRSGKKFVGGA
jgi:carbamoyl-phosphate synthase small subunit